MPHLDSAPPWAVALFAIALMLALRLLQKAFAYRARSQGLPLPPGPAPLPIIGNLFDLPKVRPWETYREFSRRHGKIMSLSVMEQCIIVVNDPQVAIDLLEKRSSIYSSRPKSPIIELSGWGWNIGLLPYGQDWRSQRRMFWQHFHPGIISKYSQAVEKAACRLACRLLTSPDNVGPIIRDSLGEVFIRTAYGLNPSESNNKYTGLFEKAISDLDVLISGTNLLEFFPFLANVPTWLPGTSFLRRLADIRHTTTAIREVPWADSKEAILTGEAPTSMASALFDDLSRYQGEEATTREDMTKSILAVTYAGGIDTSSVSLCSFFLAMSLYPDVQQKAQVELDAFVGSSRIPQLTDRDKLPYVNAIVKEVLRWHTAVPLCLPHLNIADDVYEGYFIPKDSIILPNVWSMMHDEEAYPEPKRFYPERFLGEDGKLDSKVRDPATIVFGFGRRVCPGRHFAEASLFLYIATALHFLNISAPIDNNGQPIRIELQASNDIISRVLDCRCTVKPRTTGAETLIRKYTAAA
ncbi:cytochrome P450 98A3 [Daedaleopsis nitida]|nr:cytochrome P450 98A3 [Daedaleopsis nitida]